MEGIIIAEEDRTQDGNLTEGARQKVFKYLDDYFDSEDKFSIRQLAKVLGVQRITVRRLLADYSEYSKALMAKSSHFLMGQNYINYLYTVLDDIDAGQIKFNAPTDKIDYRLRILDKLMECEKAMHPPAEQGPLGDTEGFMAWGRLGSRMRKAWEDRYSQTGTIIKPDGSSDLPS